MSDDKMLQELADNYDLDNDKANHVPIDDVLRKFKKLRKAKCMGKCGVCQCKPKWIKNQEMFKVTC